MEIINEEWINIINNPVHNYTLTCPICKENIDIIQFGLSTVVYYSRIIRI